MSRTRSFIDFGATLTHCGFPVSVKGHSVLMEQTLFIHSNGTVEASIASWDRNWVALNGTTGPVEISKPSEWSVLARIHRFIQVDGVRTAEGCEGVTGAIIRARRVGPGRSPGGLQALLGAPMAVYDGPGGQDEDRGHGRNRSRTRVARVCGDIRLCGG